MTNLQKQIRLNALLEVMETVRKSGISYIEGDLYSKFYDVVENAIPELDPLNEPDLTTRAWITKNLLAAFEIQTKHGDLIRQEDWNNVRLKIIDAINDESFKNSDDEIAKEIQNINIANIKRQLRRVNNIYDKEDKNTVDDQLLEMLEDTINNNTLNQELTAEDLVKGL